MYLALYDTYTGVCITHPPEEPTHMAALINRIWCHVRDITHFLTGGITIGSIQVLIYVAMHGVLPCFSGIFFYSVVSCVSPKSRAKKYVAHVVVKRFKKTFPYLVCSV